MQVPLVWLLGRQGRRAVLATLFRVSARGAAWIWHRWPQALRTSAVASATIWSTWGSAACSRWAA